MTSIRLVGHYTVLDAGQEWTSPPFVITLDVPGLRLEVPVDAGDRPASPGPAGGPPESAPTPLPEAAPSPPETGPAKEAASGAAVARDLSDFSRGTLLSLRGGGHQ